MKRPNRAPSALDVANEQRFAAEVQRAGADPSRVAALAGPPRASQGSRPLVAAAQDRFLAELAKPPAPAGSRAAFSRQIRLAELRESLRQIEAHAAHVHRWAARGRPTVKPGARL